MNGSSTTTWRVTWVLAAIAAALLWLASSPCLADGGNEGPDAKTTKSSLFYPTSQAMPNNPLSRVTNDGLDKIKAFYRKTFGPYDLIRDFASTENCAGDLPWSIGSAT